MSSCLHIHSNVHLLALSVAAHSLRLKHAISAARL